MNENKAVKEREREKKKYSDKRQTSARLMERDQSPRASFITGGWVAGRLKMNDCPRARSELPCQKVAYISRP